MLLYFEDDYKRSEYFDFFLNIFRTEAQLLCAIVFSLAVLTISLRVMGKFRKRDNVDAFTRCLS